MGRRDHWPYEREYWKHWAEHNQHYWNSPHAHRYARHFRRGSMLGKVIFFGLGFWAGSYFNRKYHVPWSHPREAWVEIKAVTEKLDKDNPNSQESSELRDIIDRVKQLEKKYRRPETSDESKPSTSETSAPKASE